MRSVTALIPSHVRGPQDVPSCAVHRATALSSLHPTSHGKPKQPGGDTGKVRVKRNPRSRSVSVADAGRCGQTVSVVFLVIERVRTNMEPTIDIVLTVAAHVLT